MIKQLGITIGNIKKKKNIKIHHVLPKFQIIIYQDYNFLENHIMLKIL